MKSNHKQKKQKDRERRLKVRPNINIDKLEGLASRAVGKILPKKLTEMPLEDQVKLSNKMMGMMGMANFRKRLLGDAGLCLDIRDKLKEGQTPERIKAFYWNCEPFRKLWATMECQEGMLDLLIEQEVAKTSKIT